VVNATEFVQDLDRRNLLKRNLDRPVIKDSFSLPIQNYAVIRFVADNPGIWLLHCHNEQHMDGMMLIIKVGETTDLPTKPRNWPTCGSYDQDV
jgi:L-ascorbate oxidase